MTATLNDLFGATSEVELLIREPGKEPVTERYTLRPPTLANQRMFSTFLEDRARRAASGADSQTPDEAVTRFARAVTRDIATGYYAPDAEGYVEALQRPDGMAEMLFLILRDHHPQITREKVRALVEQGLQRAYLQVLQAENDLDPKALAAVLAAYGFPENWLRSSESSSSGSPTPHSAGGPGKSSD